MKPVLESEIRSSAQEQNVLLTAEPSPEVLKGIVVCECDVWDKIHLYVGSGDEQRAPGSCAKPSSQLHTKDILKQ